MVETFILLVVDISSLLRYLVFAYTLSEHPNIRSFSVIPGVIPTDMVPKQYLHYAIDDPMLPGGLTLLLCTERAEWLRGNVVSVNWDLEEMEAHKDEILRNKLLKLAFTRAEFQKGGHPWET